MTEKQYHTGALELMPLTEKLVADTRTYESTASYDAGNRITNWNRAGAPVNNAQSWNYDDNGNWISTTKTALIWWGNSEKHRRLVGVLDRMSGASEARRVKAREASLNQCAEHKHQAGQNDIMAHPSRLNSVIARAVDGSKFKLEWYHKNYLDHVYAVSDNDGDILEHYRYTAFGEVQVYNATGTQVATTQIDNHILWNTRRRDELTGFYLYKYRHYSAELGGWLARDPIEEEGGVNLYAFVGNDPLSKWDRLGLIIMPSAPSPLTGRDYLDAANTFEDLYSDKRNTLDNLLRGEELKKDIETAISALISSVDPDAICKQKKKVGFFSFKFDKNLLDKDLIVASGTVDIVAYLNNYETSRYTAGDYEIKANLKVHVKFELVIQCCCKDKVFYGGHKGILGEVKPSATFSGSFKSRIGISNFDKNYSETINGKTFKIAQLFEGCK